MATINSSQADLKVIKDVVVKGFARVEERIDGLEGRFDTLEGRTVIKLLYPCPQGLILAEEQRGTISPPCFLTLHQI